MKRKLLMVMAKRPYPGRTKTRLAPMLEAEGAAALYACFLQDAIAIARSVPGVSPAIAYAPDDQETRRFMAQIAPQLAMIPQVGPTLGARLDDVLTKGLAQGFDQVAAMNSDSPDLPLSYLQTAFQALDEPQVDVVLGPCEDGGYYLIGWKRPHPRLVREVQMSTENVLRDTLAIAAEEGLQVVLLPTWYDIDETADLRRLVEAAGKNGGPAPHTRAFLVKHDLPPINAADGRSPD